MKKRILPFLVFGLMASTAASAQQANPRDNVQLESFEKCNNWARHYCQSGDHEQLVNEGLLEWKRKGVQITTKRIKVLSQKVRQNLKLDDSVR